VKKIIKRINSNYNFKGRFLSGIMALVSVAIYGLVFDIKAIYGHNQGLNSAGDGTLKFKNVQNVIYVDEPDPNKS